MPLDDQVAALLETLEAQRNPPLHELDPPTARAVFKRLSLARNGGEVVLPDAVTTCDRSVAVEGRDIAVRIFTPPHDGGPVPVTIHAHGGGWVVGDLDTHAGQAADICALSGSVVVSVDYRLAPEHPFPAAVEDVAAVTRWVARHAEELGGDTDRLGLAGDSAGANVVAAVALGGQVPLLSAQLLVYPATDPTMQAPSVAANGAGYFLEARAMRWFWDAYVPDAGLHRHPDVAVHCSPRLGAAPPTVIVTAEFDPLRDEGEQLAGLLEAAGVPTTLRRFDGLVHGFFGMGAVVDRAADAIAWSCAAYAKLLR